MARSRAIDEFTKPTGTVIGNGFTIHAAHFSCSDTESMRIDGTVVGNIQIDGVLIISESGYVDGNVIASSVRVAGRVTGNMLCHNALHFASTADVTGDVRATTFIVDDGAIFMGRCQTNTSMDVGAIEVAY